MTLFDVLRARQMQGGSIPESTIVGVPPISFAADGTPLSAWIVLGNIDLGIAPSPDNIIMPQEFGDKTANLFDADKWYGEYKQADNAYVATYANFYQKKIKPFTSNDIGRTFTFSMNISTSAIGNARVSAIINGTTFNGTTSNHYSTLTFTVQTVNDTVFFNYGSLGETVTTLSNIMLNAGSAALTYEPYGVKIPIALGTTYPIYLSAPIRAMGEHADAAASTGVVTRRVRKITFDGTESGWALFSGNGAYQFYIGNALSSALAVSGSSALSNIAPYGATAATRAEYQYGCYPISSGQGIAFQMYGSASAFPDVPAWKAFLEQMSANGTPVAAWYILAEPQEEAFEAPILTPTAGTNTLSVDTTLQPTSVSVTGHIRQT